MVTESADLRLQRERTYTPPVCFRTRTDLEESGLA